MQDMASRFHILKFSPFGLVIAFLYLASSVSAQSLPAFTAADRILVLAPHPDDEVIACGGIIQQAVAAQAAVQVVFLTYGDNNEWSFAVYRKHPVLEPSAVRQMGLTRHDEAVQADRVLGLPAGQLTFLGYPDFGTLHIWESHWGDQPPFQSMLTKVVQVPYTNAFRPDAPYKGEEILRDLESIIAGFQPTRIFLSHPADHNPDHRALYLFARVALWDLHLQPEPVLCPYLVHYRQWPVPRAYAPAAALTPAFELGAPGGWLAWPLVTNQVAIKENALRQHRTQFAYAARYLESFVRTNELFGDFPPIVVPADSQESRIELDADNILPEPAEELTDAEKARFVGIETRHVWREGDTLAIEMDFSRPWLPGVESQIEVFGYRTGTPFAAMPKLLIRAGEFGCRVLDQQRPLPDSRVHVLNTPYQVQIRIPLAELGHPDRILTSGRTYLVDLPLDWVSWRILELPPATHPVPSPS